jgi:hypothetical protein
MMAKLPRSEKQKQNLTNQPQKTKKRSLFWSLGLGLVLVLILVVAVILNTAGGKQLIQFNQPNNAEISPTKSIQIKPSQITLTPEQSDSIGVLESSKYILKSEIKLTKYQVTDNLKLDPKQEIEITQKSDKEFLLKLKNVFDPGSVQKFSLNIEDTSNQNQTKELSWAFQTYQKFAVTKTIPESNTSDISTNSKIEVEFNTETFQSIENFWEISPPTKGKFVKIGNKINFIPEKLEPATIYTITIKKGLALEGSKQVLDNDFSWQFETQQDSQVAENRTYFNQEFYEFSQSVSPNITLGGKLGDKANLELYKFRDLGQFLEYLKTKQQLPNWTNYQDQKEKYDLKNLQKVLGESFGIEKTDTQNFVKFPAQLEKGFYLLHLPENQNSAILQSTDLTVNFTTDNNKILTWANNIQTQKPASIAQIKDINGEQLAVTDDSGLAFFDKPKPKNNEDRYQFYQVISDKEILIVSTTKTKQNSPLNETKNANYWSYLYLDKNTYKPSDKISFWGLAKSRTGEKIDSLKAVVYKIENQKTVLIQDQTISLSSLDTFLSSLNLQNLPEGNYQLNLQKNTENEIIINSNFRVQNPTPKNYQILLESNKKFYLKNEEIVISGKVNFKDQTPASQVSLNYSGDVNGEVVTDNFGNFSIKYPVSSIVQKSYQPIAHTSILVQLKNPQESDIKSSLKIPYFPYQIIISDQSKTDTSKGILDINLNSLDTSKYTSGLQNINNLKGNPIGSKDILAQITSYVFDKIETGQNYNPITKQTETQYSYTRRDKKQTETKVSTDNQGLARLEISFESETYYQINLQLTDSDNKNILFSRYFSTTTNSSPETTQNFQFIDQKAQNLSQKNYQPGEVVKLEIQKNGQTDIPQTNSNYLIIQSQNGIKKYSLQSKSQYEYNFTESGIPNINFSGVKFDGKNYSKISPEGYPVNFTKENQELKVEIFSNKSVYQSGENASVEFKISDLKNEPKKSKILVWVSPKTANGENLEINKSENIYSNLSTGINQNYNSHSDSTSPQKLTKSDLQNEPKKSEVIFFEEIESDQNGLAKANFNLPDSFDSWDILAKVVSSDLFFGSNLATIYTATDLQIASILSSDYLENDQPSIKLQTIGEKLDPKTEVEYTIEIPYLEFKKTQKGLASGVEVQLPKLKIGELELNLSVKNGEKQSKIQQIISVKSTNQKSITQQFTYPELSQKASLTNLPEDQTFQVVIGSAENIGYYTQLQKMANSDSGTLESLQISYLAKKLLTQYYDSTKKPNAPELDTFNKNGGFSNFPDSQKDIKFTTQVLESDLNNLTGTRSFNFFKAENSKVQENFEDHLWILFGLTLNQHNVLQQLQNLNQKTDLTLNQKLIISQALDYAGDKEKARQNYYQILQENSQVSDNSKYIKGDNLDQNLELTNQALGLANLLNEPDAKDLNEYLAKNNYSSFKQILYLQKTLKNLKTDKIIFSYQIDGQKKEVTVEYNKLFKINLNKKALEDLNLEIKTGEISLGLNYTLAFESNPNQPKITRIYQTENTPTNKFNKNDLVNVGLEIEFGNNLLDGCYKVSDQVPAGLKIMPEKITDSINQITPYQNDTKTINFCIYPNQTGLSTIKINYFAKAFSAGGFNVQSATIENLKSDSSLNLSPKQTVEIN